MSIVSVVDQALYEAGLTYTNVINMFNKEQSGKWSERLHNYDYTFKYLDVWLDNANMQLEKLQGPRRTHREWWLSNRFAIYDAKNHTGQYLKSFVSIKPSTDGAASQGDVIKVTPAVDGQVFGWRLGTNGTVYSYDGTKGTPINYDLYNANISYYIGGSLFFFNAVYMDKIDFSAISSHIQELSFADVNSDVANSYLEEVVVADPNSTTNTAMSGVSNLSNVKYLRKFQMCNCTGVPTIDLSSNGYLEEVDVRGCSSLASVSFPVAAPVTTAKLSSGLQTLQMKDLISLTTLTVENNGPSLTNIHVTNCKPFTDSIDWLYTWFTGKSDSFLEGSTVYIDGVNWTGVSVEQLVNLGKIGNLTLKGVIQANLSSDNDTLAQQISQLQAIYGEHCFESTNDLWITGNTSYVTLVGPSTIVEGEMAQYTLVVVGVAGSARYSVINNNRPGVIINELTGMLSTTLNNEEDSTLTVMAQFTPEDTASANYYVKTKVVTVLKETYPSNSDITISGDTGIYDSTNRNYSAVVANTENYTGMSHLTHQWSVTGDLADYFYIASQPANALTCVMACSDSSYVVAGGTITLSFYNSLGTMVASQSLEIVAQSGNVAVSRLTNAPVMNAFWAAFGTNGTKTAGKVSNENYITKFEASKFENSDLGDGTAAGSVLYPYRTSITHFEEIQYFSGLTEIPANFFSGCTNLAGNIPLPSTVTNVDIEVFSGLSKLTGTLSGDGVITVTKFGGGSAAYFSKYVFPNCTSFAARTGLWKVTNQEVYIPKCTAITNPGYLFYNGGSLRLTIGTLHLPAAGGSAIALTVSKYCTDENTYFGTMSSFTSNLSRGIRSVSIEDDVTRYEVEDGCLYDVVNKKLVLVTSPVTTVNVRKGYNVAPYAAFGCKNLTSITIPEDATIIGNRAFIDNSALTTVTGGQSLTTIDVWSFYGCTALESFTGTSSLTTIADGAFQNCTALSSFVFSDTLTSLGQRAFYNTGLTSLSVNNSNLVIGSYAFSTCNSLVSATLGVKSVGSLCFQNCTSLTSLNFTALAINGLGNQMANGCTSLTYVHVPDT